MSVYRRKDTGQFRYDFWLGGRRFLGSLEAKTQKVAEAEELLIRAKVQAAMEEERRTGKPVLTLDAAALRYWNEAGQDHRDHKKTMTDLARVVEYLGPQKRLDEITDADVTAMVAWRRAQRPTNKVKSDPDARVSPATVNRSTTEVLKKLFTRAKNVWRYTFPNEPNWRAHMLKEPAARVRELKGDEEKNLGVAIRSDYEPWVRFTLLTGLRRAETLIKWENVDRIAKVITTRGKGGRIVTAPITPAVEEILASVDGQHAEYVFTYVAKRADPRKKLVKGGRYPITYAGSKTEWRRLVKRAKVKDFRFHDLRHTTATRLLRQTGNLALVQKALNHADITTTARYAHVFQDEVATALQQVAELHKPADSPAIDPKKAPKTGT
jgi:integrase